MNKLKVLFNDSVAEALESVLSCFIPNKDKFDGIVDDSLYFKYFRELKKIIYRDELQGEYYLIFLALERLSELKVYSSEASCLLDRKSFEASLSVSVEQQMRVEKYRFSKSLSQGVTLKDLEVETIFNEQIDRMFTLTLELYDRCSESELDIKNALKYLDILKEEVQSNLNTQSLQNAAQILMESGYKVEGKLYKGNDGYLEYLSEIPALINSRFSTYMKKNTESFDLTSIEALKQFEKDSVTKKTNLFQFGFEPYDNLFTIMSKEIVTFVADEGIGKTNMNVYLSVECLCNGFDVLIMCGETEINKMKNMIFSRYIFKSTGSQYTHKELENPLNLTEEEITEINLCKAKFITDESIGKIHFIDKFTYEHVTDEVTEKVTEFPNIKLVMIDHTDALASDGSFTVDGRLTDKKKRVDFLYDREIELKRNLGISFVNFAHTSSDAEKSNSKGKNTDSVNIAATSRDVTKDSDYVFYLFTDTDLNKEDYVKIQGRKIRDYKNDRKVYLLKKMFECCTFEYNVNDQFKLEVDAEEIDDVY